MGAELFHMDRYRTDGRTDGQDKANNRFSQFFNAPKILFFFYPLCCAIYDFYKISGYFPTRC
jgi:hypothetical protein